MISLQCARRTLGGELTTNPQRTQNQLRLREFVSSSYQFVVSFSYQAPGLKYLVCDNYLNNAATEISSSNSSQCIPIPLPISLHLFLCSLLASRNLGNHSRGILISLPSRRRTCIISMLNHTSDAITSVILVIKVLMPSLLKNICIF